MDAVKAEMNRRCDVGGIKCHCCNEFHGKDKPGLGRMVRRTNKQKLQEEYETYLEEERMQDFENLYKLMRVLMENYASVKGWKLSDNADKVIENIVLK